MAVTRVMILHKATPTSALLLGIRGGCHND